jgi:tetratricopeptide (TPR) repeat protein
MFSARTLMTILDGVEQLANAGALKESNIAVTRFHISLFERLQLSFNNPTLLKEIGSIYLNEFQMPGMALKHFDLARQFAPKDRDIEQLQKTATLALAKEATDQPSHSGLGEVTHAKPELDVLMRKTTRINVVETRRHLDEAAGELERKQQILRKTGSLKKRETEPVETRFDVLLETAQRAILQTDFAAAAEVLAKAQKAGAPREELQAYYAQLGLSAYDHGRMQEALQAYLTMRDLGPESMEGWFNCGLVHQKMGQLDDALTSYQEAVRLVPDNPKSLCNLGAVQFERAEYAEAEKTLRQALALKPDYARAWDNLASTLGAMNRLDEAAAACREAIRLQPAFHSAWFKLGVINFQQDNLVAATEAFNLTGDNPDFFAYVLYYMSMIEARRGEMDEALQKLTLAQAADPNNDLELLALTEIATVCTKFGKHAAAADFYAQMTGRHPADFSAWFSLGTAHHRTENFEQAKIAYQRALDLRPDDPVLWHNLGLLASDQGNHSESRDCFQREVDLAPGDAKAWYDLGVSLQQLGQQEESEAAFDRAEKLVNTLARRSSDLSAALSIVRRLNLGDRLLKTE